jgi:hypothetical protein
MTAWELALVVPAAIAGSLTLLAAGRLQSEGKFLLATLVSQGSCLPLLLAALVAILWSGLGDGPVLVLFALGLAVIAAWSWTELLSRRAAAPEAPFPWHEALAITGMCGAAVLFFNLERLAIPLLLPPRDLAHFAVLAALVIAPFRMLQFGVGRTLVPRLRDAPTAAARRRLLRHEAGVVGGVALAAGAVLAVATPLVEAWVLGGKYATPPLLLAIVILAGAVKLANAFAQAAVQAAGDLRTLRRANHASWASLGLATLAGTIGAASGLTGLIAGTTLGAALQAGIMLALVAPRLRDPSV